ncbi:MAG: DUF1573 domain-containing protein [Saprospiraceae bacterium]|nr:DUF1573 domain-containing protein [Saprospiraceae bacterium]
MKQLFFIFSFLAFGTMAAMAQTAGPVTTFEKTTHDFGMIDKNADAVYNFKFTNMGNEPLIIKSGKASCSGVKVAYPKEPIMPGETAYIDATYDTKRVGPFNKWISLTTNEIPDTHSLIIKGEVKAPPTQESGPSNGGLNIGN